MLLRIAIIVLGGGYVAYRVAIAMEIIKARRTGDVVREQHLRRHGFGLHRWILGACAVVFLVLMVVLWADSR
jgi:hypothetical protein